MAAFRLCYIQGLEQPIQQQQCVLPDFLEEIPDPK
jgi:hypothetical protein